MNKIILAFICLFSLGCDVSDTEREHSALLVHEGTTWLPDYHSMVRIFRDEKRHNTCYIATSRGGYSPSISCLKD